MSDDRSIRTFIFWASVAIAATYALAILSSYGAI